MADLVIARTAQGGFIGTAPVVIGFDDIEFQTVPTLVTTGANWRFTARNPARYVVSVSLGFASPNLTNTPSLMLLLCLLKNGSSDASAHAVGVTTNANAPTMLPTINLSKVVSLAVNDTIQATIAINGPPVVQLSGDSSENWITIYELP